jgi:hypothetical protein
MLFPDAGTKDTPGNPGTAILNIDKTSIDMGVLYLGKTTYAFVVISNIGDKTSGVLVTVPAGPGISATGCTGALAPHTSCSLSIGATPTSAGVLAGSVSVSAAPGTATPLQIAVTAKVLQSSFSVAPTAIDLGNVAVGQAVQVTVTVQAESDLTGLNMGVSGPDLLVDATTTCTSVLAAGTTCAAVVNFRATTVGVATSDSIVVSQGGVSKAVPITAMVFSAAKLAATPMAASLVAGPGATSSPVDVNVGNVGGMATGLLGVALTGANAADFRITKETCSIVALDSAKFCTVTVVYAPAPTAMANEVASLTVTDTGPGASVATVALSGAMPSAAALTITGGPSLGTVAPGASGSEVVFTVTNTSVTPSGALSVAVSSPLIAISSNTCTAGLAQGNICTVGLKLTPPTSATPEAVAAILTVTAATAKVAASVTGTVVTVASYSKTIAPMMTASCALSGCHAGSSPNLWMGLDTYANVKANAAAANSAIQAGAMPIGAGVALTAADKKNFQDWVSLGAPNN